jgi:glycosyltransferase involved in cell wall biosynthesis
MKLEKIVVLTRGYPYAKEGEEFFRYEIEELDKRFGSVTYLPYPKEPHTPSIFGRLLNLLVKLAKGLRYFPFRAFSREIVWLLKDSNINPCYLWNLVTDGLQTGNRIWQIRSLGFQPDIIYSFWGGADGLASALEGRACPRGAFVRLHNFDLYEVRRSGYQPFLRSIAGSEVTVILLSDSASKYLQSVANVRNSVIIPLGVGPSENTHTTEGLDPLHFLTIAYPSPTKRLDHAALILSELSKTSKRGITWTHVGGTSAQHEELHNVFLGLGGRGDLFFHASMKHQGVMELVERSGAGWVLNTSLSEGTPVSIMEAMARGKNVIAPDIGGIKDLLADTVGNIIFKPDEPLDALLQRLRLCTTEMSTGVNQSNIDKIRLNFDGNRSAVQLLSTFER